MVNLHGGRQVLELLVGIVTAPCTHDCRAAVLSAHEGRMTLNLKSKESPVCDICLDLEVAGGRARERIGSYSNDY